MFRLSRSLGKTLARYLSTPRAAAQVGTPAHPRKLLATLRPGDVVLVEGSSRISAAIKYLTQSTWSHAALYVGPQLGGVDEESGEPLLFVEADIVLGVCKRPLTHYADYHTRICRPKDLQPQDLRRLLARVVAQVGHQYDMKNVLDLARYLIPQPPVPARWRRKLIAMGSGAGDACQWRGAQRTGDTRDLPHPPPQPVRAARLRRVAVFRDRQADARPGLRLPRDRVERQRARGATRAGRTPEPRSLGTNA
jgi:hypothetical protein